MAVAVGVEVAVAVGVGVGDCGGDDGVGEVVAVGVGVGDPPLTAAKISTRPQPNTLLGGPAVPH